MKRCHSFIFKFLNSYIVAISIATVLTLSGCIEEYEADISSDDANLLVVEGSICSSQLNKFYLSRTQPVNTWYSPQMVVEATLSVRGSDGSEYKAQLANGYYACQVGDLSPEVDYYLHIECDGEVYESEPQKPLRSEEIDEVEGVQYTPESDIDVLVTPAEPFNPQQTNYYLWTYDETWEVRPDYTTDLYYDTILLKPVTKRGQFPERGWKNGKSREILVAASTNYEGQHIRQLKLYDIANNNERMYYRYSGLVHQRAISKAEYEYELARKQASSEMGGLFTPLPSSLPTNIHCLTSEKHIIGYVGCSMNISEHRFFFDVHDFTINRPEHGDDRVWVNDPSDDYCCKLVSQGLFLCEWNDERDREGNLQTAWAYQSQLDVRLRGAYVEKPDFWYDEY